MRFHRPQPLVTRPSVSVVIPCYNYGHYLPGAVASALDQRDVDVDVLIVDDASSDDSADVARRLAASDERVEVLVHETNAGHIRTYNDGLVRARGEYVALLSADDLLTSGSLARSMALMEAHPDVGLVYGFPETFEGQQPPTVCTRVSTWSIWNGDEWIRRICSRGRNIIVNPEAVMRTSLVHELGGYDEAHPHAADMKLWIEAATRARVGRVNGAVQALYREHAHNMHSTRFAGVLTDLEESRRAFEAVLGVRVADAPSSSDAQRTALRAISQEALMHAGVVQAKGGAHSDRAAADLAAFALDSHPATRRSRRWRSYQRRAGLGMVPGEARLLTWTVGVRWALRWRRWRRFGT